MKRLVFILTCLFFASVMLGCSEQPKAPEVQNPADEQFLSDMAISLEARWEISENSGIGSDFKAGTPESAEWNQSLVDAEWSVLSKYENAVFNDAKLENLALSYIAGLKKQKDAVALETTDLEESQKLWAEGYQQRTEALVGLISNYDIQIKAEFQPILDEFIAIEMGRNATLEPVESSYGWTIYEAVIVNETKQDISAYQFEVNLYDSDGVLISSTYSNIVNNWPAGTKARFQVETDADFDRYELIAWFEL